MRYCLILDVFVIDTQKQFNKMKNDNNGAYLANIFNEYDTVKIHTKDRNWTRHIYLPHLYAKKQKWLSKEIQPTMFIFMDPELEKLKSRKRQLGLSTTKTENGRDNSKGIRSTFNPLIYVKIR